MPITRQNFIRSIGALALLWQTDAFSKLVTENIQGATPVIGSQQVTTETPGAAKVYFTKHIDSDHLIKLYQLVNQDIHGKVAIKIHTGEKHGPNILPRDLVRDFQKTVPNSALVETNTLYNGDRGNTKKHQQTLLVNGWNFCPVDILDEHGAVEFPVKDGFHLKKVSLGKNIQNYDSMIVLTHFKGHGMGGFGGSLKNIAIGLADGRVGKAQVHDTHPSNQDYASWPTKDVFMENMADSGKAALDHFGKNVCFINVLRRMSVDCDCAGVGAAEPTLPDIGMLASTDILAADQASVDMVYKKSKETHDHGLSMVYVSFPLCGSIEWASHSTSLLISTKCRIIP
ncbi:MAG: DUF362 domain-containing protein [Burkholderiales bacterium]|nr:DUF362 domain-containing protein [Burkholderiales bacterium]